MRCAKSATLPLSTSHPISCHNLTFDAPMTSEVEVLAAAAFIGSLTSSASFPTYRSSLRRSAPWPLAYLTAGTRSPPPACKFDKTFRNHEYLCNLMFEVLSKLLAASNVECEQNTPSHSHDSFADTEKLSSDTQNSPMNTQPSFNIQKSIHVTDVHKVINIKALANEKEQLRQSVARQTYAEMFRTSTTPPSLTLRHDMVEIEGDACVRLSLLMQKEWSGMVQKLERGGGDFAHLKRKNQRYCRNQRRQFSFQLEDCHFLPQASELISIATRKRIPPSTHNPQPPFTLPPPVFIIQQLNAKSFHRSSHSLATTSPHLLPFHSTEFSPPSFQNDLKSTRAPLEQEGAEAKQRHLVVCVHGFMGEASDFRLFKNMLLLHMSHQPPIVLLSRCNSATPQSTTVQQHSSDPSVVDAHNLDILIMGQRLANEIKLFIGDCCGQSIAHISFIGHSLGVGGGSTI